MIEADYTLEVDVAVDEVWRYVEVIPHWAPHMVGYQKVDLVDEWRSVWTLRGDVGVLAREVDIRADITRWEPPRRAEFTVTGVTERLSGGGWFDLAEAGAGDTAAPVRRPGPLRRLRFRLVRWFLRRLGRRSAVPDDRPAGDGGDGGEESAGDDRAGSPNGAARPGGAGRSRLTFHLEIAPGGPMAPMVELLMRPMIEPAAQDFLDRIRRDLEGRKGSDPRARGDDDA